LMPRMRKTGRACWAGRCGGGCWPTVAPDQSPPSPAPEAAPAARRAGVMSKAWMVAMPPPSGRMGDRPSHRSA
jgi:hypothetical protein